MSTPSRRAGSVPVLALAAALAIWIVPGSPAFARGGHGGGGHGGGGHGGGHGGHSGGHHGGGHYGGGYHHGGYHYGGHHGYYGGFGGYGYGYYPGYGYGGYGYGYYPSYGYGNYGSGYSYPYYGYSTPTYGTSPAYVAQGPTTYASLGQGRFLGIDETPVSVGGSVGMQVTQVYSGSPAERAGLQVGDVIVSANGYLAQQHGNLTWILSQLPANGVLQMNVRTARDGTMHAVSATIP